MSDKQKITLTQNHKYQFSHLLKHFQTAANNTPQYLDSADIYQIIFNMGFIPEEPSDQDHELIKTIAFMLSSPEHQGMVSQRNLFRFLMALTETGGRLDSYFQHVVQPLPKDLPFQQQPLVKITLGNFNQDGLWNPTKKEEHDIRQIFKRMIYTRSSRNNLQGQKKTKQEQEHKPLILSKSRAIAKQKFQKEGYWKVEDRLLEAKKMTESKIERELGQSRQKEVENCSFKPTINSLSLSLDKENNSNMNRSQLLLSKGKQYDLKLKMKKLQHQHQIQKMNISRCSFHPDLSNSRQSLRYSIKRERVCSVKNQEMTISRLRQAREQREYLNQVKRRGYPAGVSWIKYIKENRNSISHNQSFTEVPSITLDLEYYEEQLSLQVKAGQQLDDIVSLLTKKWKVPTSLRYNLLTLLQKSIESSGKARINRGKVCFFDE